MNSLGYQAARLIVIVLKLNANIARKFIFILVLYDGFDAHSWLL